MSGDLAVLEQMSLTIPDRRPALINDELVGELQGFLAFRHRFRNLYGFELEWSRMQPLVKKLPGTLRQFRNAVRSMLKNFH